MNQALIFDIVTVGFCIILAVLWILSKREISELKHYWGLK